MADDIECLDFSVERMVAGGARLQIRAVAARRHPSPALAKGVTEQSPETPRACELRLRPPLWLYDAVEPGGPVRVGGIPQQ
jgi:hypothetical protein